MQITTRTGEVLSEPSDLAVLAGYEDAALPAEVTALFEANDFRGRAKQTLLIYPGVALAPRRLLLVGLGKRESAGAEQIR